MTSTPVTSHPVTDRVREALAVTLRGADELIPEADWLQKLARAEATPTDGATEIGPVIEALRSAFAGLSIRAGGEETGPIGISAENLRIVLSHLADNAGRHGATRRSCGVSTCGVCNVSSSAALSTSGRPPICAISHAVMSLMLAVMPAAGATW